MSAGHSHSHRKRRPTHRTPPDDARPMQRQARIERRRAEVAAGPREVVVQIPWGRRATAGQQSGIPLAPGGGYPSRWVREALVRQAREREEAARR